MESSAVIRWLLSQLIQLRHELRRDFYDGPDIIIRNITEL